MMSELDRWHVGGGADAGRNDGIVALTATDQARFQGRARVLMGFHQAMTTGALPSASQVHIDFPPYRGKAFVPVLGWLATRLGVAEAVVSWRLDKRQGPASVAALLASLGWKVEARRAGRTTTLTGNAPIDHPAPAPREFDAEFDGEPLQMVADYGVFSPGRVDAGTRLLFDVATTSAPVDTLCDIGTGYGPLAVGLVHTGVAERAVGTDVDCVALWLAQHNARTHRVALEVTCSPDPLAVVQTPLTVCNVPTHITAEQTRVLLAGLLARARYGRLLMVVHASLVDRYARYFTAAGLTSRQHPGPTHVVLDSAA
jgi:16S rRNA G1207 methylase RsmC